MRTETDEVAISTPPDSTRIASPGDRRNVPSKKAPGVERTLEGRLSVALLTGGSDKPYALGLTSELSAQGMRIDFIGSDHLDVPELRELPFVNFRNLRGDQQSTASYLRKALRILAYYWRLIIYAAVARPRVFHILWNDRFELFERTVLMLYYRLLGKKILFTAHNVNAGKRDGNDTLVNRLSLKAQYHLCHHIFVHTEQMKTELRTEFDVRGDKVSVIPFGINNTYPNTSLTTQEARRLLGVGINEKALLFFGNIVPYKGLEYLIAALGEVASKDESYRLIIAGRATGSEDYWSQIKQTITRMGASQRIIERIEYIADDQVEVFFKAADVLVLPYCNIFQSGVLFLGYSFGLPVIAADVGSLREDIVESETGFVFKAQDSAGLARVIEAYFASPLFRDLASRRQSIRDFANERYSWSKAGKITTQVYRQVLN